MHRKVSILHSQSDVTECVALTKCVHGIEDGFGMGVGHDVFGSHCTVLRVPQVSRISTCCNIWQKRQKRQHSLEAKCKDVKVMTNYMGPQPLMFAAARCAGKIH